MNLFESVLTKKCYKSDFYHSVIDEESNKICFLSDYRVKQSLLDKTVPFFTNISGDIVLSYRGKMLWLLLQEFAITATYYIDLKAVFCFNAHLRGI